MSEAAPILDILTAPNQEHNVVAGLPATVGSLDRDEEVSPSGYFGPK
jgi:hypothetical protein